MEQMSIFDYMRPGIRVDKPVRLIELFAGYGSQYMALKRIKADVESYKIVEFDPVAVKAYNAVHGTQYKASDIRDVKGEDLEIVNKDKYCYMLTYSFPCTDISYAGTRSGMSKGSGTRSGLLWEVERIFCEIRDSHGSLPDILFLENVPSLKTDRNISDFRDWGDFLSSLGYVNYCDVLNAKDFGVPQNRERCFMISFLQDYNYHFPVGKKLDKTLPDILEDDVDKKYYLTSKRSIKMIKRLVSSGYFKKDEFTGLGFVDSPVDEVEDDDKANSGREIKVLGTEEPDFCGCLYLNTTEAFFRCPSPIAKTIKAQQHDSGILLKQPIIVASRGRNPKNPSDRVSGHPTEQRLEPNSSGVSNTVTTVQKDNLLLEGKIVQLPHGFNKGGTFDIVPTLSSHGWENNNYLCLRYFLRRLTPRECLRLMDVTDEDIDKMIVGDYFRWQEIRNTYKGDMYKEKILENQGISDSQLYTLAGNSIVVSVMAAMFENINFLKK